MGDASSSNLDRLALLPALVLIAYVLLTLPAGGVARDPLPVAAGQVYAETACGRSRALRPGLQQANAPDTLIPQREDEVPGDPPLVLLPPPSTFPAPTAAYTSRTTPACRRHRTHNPRDPPAA